MLIHCPACSSAYDLPAECFAAPGQALRCASCREIWSPGPREREPDPPDEIAASEFEETGLVAIETAESFAPPPPMEAAVRVPEIVAEARSGRTVSPPPPAARSRPRRRSGRPAALVKAVRSAMGGMMAPGMVATGMAGVAARERIVRAAPVAAALYDAIGLPVNLRGLGFRGVRSSLLTDAADHVPVLTLEGRIANLRHAPTPVPALRIAVRDKAQNELYSWIALAPKPRLEAGESIVFRSRLAAPPQDGQELVVSFADPADAPGAERRQHDGP